MEPRLPRGLVRQSPARTATAAPSGGGVSASGSLSCSGPSPTCGEWRPRRGTSLGARGPQVTTHGEARRRSAAPPPLQKGELRPASLSSVAVGVRVPRHGLHRGSITISIVLSLAQDLLLPLLREALWLRRNTRSTAACRVVLGFFTAPLHFALFRAGRASMTASLASPPSSTATSCYHLDGRKDQLRESTLAPRTMLRHTASTSGTPEVSPRDDDTPQGWVWGLHLGQGTAPMATSPNSLHAGTAGSLPLAPAAWLCPG